MTEPPSTPPSRRSHLAATWLTGLLAVLPLVLTVVLVGWAVQLVNRFVGPGSLFGRSFTVFGTWFAAHPLLSYLAGTLLVLVLIYLLGLVVRSRLKRPLKALLDKTLRRIPLIGSVYSLAERFVSVIGDRQQADIATMRPVWCRFGGNGAAVLGLLANPEPVMIGGDAHLTVLVPTAPIPVGGGLLYVPEAWVVPADFGIDTVTAIYLSMGLTAPRREPTQAQGTPQRVATRDTASRPKDGRSS